MPSESQESQVNNQESTSIITFISQVAAAALSLLTRLFTPTPPPANANERTGLSESHALINSHNLIINGGHFNHTLQIDHEMNQSQVPSRSQEIQFQKSNDIYERHLILEGRGFPLWIPDPNQALHLDYRRTGVRIGDVGIITHSGAFSFLFNICLPHNDPVNPRMLPEHFAPIWPPIEATDIENFIVFKNGSHLASASVKKRSQTGTAISNIVFESSASEGAILTMPQGARSQDLGNLARFRDYAAANVANWYRFVNGPRGREAKNGDVRLVVGFDKTTSWGIATFANQTQQNGCLLKFGPSEGDSASTYTWSEYSGVANVRAGPGTGEINELRIDGDPPDVQFENQCLFVRTLNVTLADDLWADMHSSSGSIAVDPRNSQYPRIKDYSYSNRSNNPDNGSNFSESPPQGAQSGTQRRLQGVDFMSDENPPIFVSGPVESIAGTRTTHPSKVLNDTLLANIPTAKMVITHDDDWSSVTQYDTSLVPHEFVANILASRDIYQENGVIFLQPKKIINEISDGSTSANRAQVPEAAVVQGSPGYHVSPLIHDKPIGESFHPDLGGEYVNKHTDQFSTKKPVERLQCIQDGLQYLQYGQSEYVRNFGMTINQDPLSTNARVIEPPKLRYNIPSPEPSIKPKDGAGNMIDKRFYVARTIVRWVVVIYESQKNFPPWAYRGLVDGFLEACDNVGMTVENREPIFKFEDGQGSIDKHLTNAVNECQRQFKQKPTLIVIILPDLGGDIYHAVKHFGDITFGIPTQCLKSTPCKKANSQYWNNIMLKVNVKLGGINVIPESPTLHRPSENRL